MEQVINKREELKGQLKTLGIDNYKQEIEDLKQDIELCDRNIKSGIDHIKRYSARKRENTLKITAYKRQDKTPKDYTSDIDAILSHPTVTNMEVDINENNKYVRIYTDYIDIYDEKGNRFRGNKYKIRFDFNDMDVRIYGEDSDYSRESCWGEGCPHPHVDCGNGRPCLGDAGPMIAMNMNEYELYASYIVILNFLQQVNVNDGAGEYIYNWDCIDEDDNVIENPYSNSRFICSECERSMSREDMTSCEECGANLCCDHYYFMDDDDAYVCENCRDEHYDFCEECNCWYLKDNMITVENGDRCCEHCVEDKYTKCEKCGDYVKDTNTLEGEEYCDECFEEVAISCDKCGSVMLDGNQNHCSGCGDQFCDECFGDMDMCNDCEEENTYVCQGCGNNTNKEDNNVCVKCNFTYCSDCFDMGKEMCRDCEDNESEEE